MSILQLTEIPKFSSCEMLNLNERVALKKLRQSLVVHNYLIKWKCTLIILLLPLFAIGQSKIQQQLLDSLRINPTKNIQYVNWLNSLAHTYWNTDPKKTDSLGNIALSLSNELDYKKGICNAYHEMAVGQWMLGNYPLAHENANKELKTAEENNIESNIIDAYSILALIYDDQGLVKESLKYHELVLEYRISKSDSVNMATSLNNIASVYFQMDSLDKSLELFRYSYSIRKAIDAKRGMRESLSNIAYVLNHQGKPKEAMPLIKESLQIARELNDLNGIINIGSSLGSVYLNLNELDSAEQILLNTLPLAEKMGVNKRIIEIKGFLFQVYEQKNNYKKAFEFIKDYWILKDSIEGQETTNRILELQTQYESEKKEKEIFMLQQQNEQSEGWRNIFALGAFTMVIIAGFIYLLYRYSQLKSKKLIEAKDTQTKQLQELNQMKSQFLANISHEFRTPLTLIIGPTKQLLTQINDRAIKQQLDWIHENSQKLLKLINQLLELSKLEAGKHQLKASQQDLVAFCKYIFNLFESLATQKNIKFVFKSEQEQIYVFFDAEKLEEIINNLLSNAFKFTENGVISIQIAETQIDSIGYAKITIRDSGIGIHNQQLPYIFDRFYQASHDESKDYAGTGIGLALSKELVELHSGKIDVKSELGKGTSFNVLLPLGKGHLKDEDILTNTDHSFKEIANESTEIKYENKSEEDINLPLLLIIDDNKDIVEYIQLLLEGKYRFLNANDGKNGLEIAQQELPDLIISDVMMPGLTGLQLCDKLKNDFKTDHIPVILLTAKVGIDEKIKGLEAKADGYIQKPFNKKELEIKIQNLIDNRNRLRKRFANKVIFQPSEVAENTQEERFLKNIKDVIEKEYTDPLFDVMKLCDLMCMSKSQLNRKMKAVFNKSPNQFIRSYRLEKAKQLILKSRDITLAEVAFDVGFASPAYFSKCFHDEYGYSPSEIRQ